MGTPIRFKCLKCGYCCAHLINETSLGKLGIFLLPQERGWFPQETIIPLYGAGLKGKRRLRPQVIYAFQSTLKRCPWFDERSHLCLIYEHRPSVCRAYPLSGTCATRECRFLAMQSQDDEEISLEISTIKEELKADRETLNYIIAMRSKYKGPMWVYPNDEKKWKMVTGSDLNQYLPKIPGLLSQILK